MINPTILDLAQKLGNVIHDSEEIRHLNETEQAYNDCGELQAKVTEYYVNQKASMENKDEELGVAITRRMEEIYSEIEAHPVYAAYMQAQYAVRDLMNAVNDQIQLAVSGKNGCSPEKCASCKACASKQN